MFSNKILISIAKTHNKSIAQVILRCLSKQNIVSIPKLVNNERIVDNFDIFDVKLNLDEINQIKSLLIPEKVYFYPTKIRKLQKC